jgi:hypothetical protein
MKLPPKASSGTGTLVNFYKMNLVIRVVAEDTLKLPSFCTYMEKK